MTRMCSSSRETRTYRAGTRWVFVRADQPGAAAIVEALERGDFYASTGVELADYEVTASAMNHRRSSSGGQQIPGAVIGRNGQVLSEVASSPAERFRGDELYVRAKVLESNGRVAWTQPAGAEARRSADTIAQMLSFEERSVSRRVSRRVERRHDRPAGRRSRIPHRVRRRRPLSAARRAGVGENTADQDARAGGPPQVNRIQFTPDLMPSDSSHRSHRGRSRDRAARHPVVPGPCSRT